MKHFITLSELPSQEAIKDAFLSALHTENFSIAYTDMKAGATIPLHEHPEEAIDIVLDGILEMQIGESFNTLNKGMISVVPSNIPHRARAMSNCRVITIFYPKRNL